MRHPSGGEQMKSLSDATISAGADRLGHLPRRRPDVTVGFAEGAPPKGSAFARTLDTEISRLETFLGRTG